jgi:hypothetical protein
VRSDYTQERTHRQLMQLYALAGDRSMALRQFVQCRAALMQEFGIQPTAPPRSPGRCAVCGWRSRRRRVGSPARRRA